MFNLEPRTLAKRPRDRVQPRTLAKRPRDRVQPWPKGHAIAFNLEPWPKGHAIAFNLQPRTFNLGQKATRSRSTSNLQPTKVLVILKPE
ncbi:MAG: hypothetical protein F6J90_17365 [Moorea sp. SIOASIH]|uniref:hypothetical protein n=1 Tax=Moorena sp. SIOASIH TaxID=2607817 RepID=UPI0013B89407|nr:hypothetical protein [Moorena sp. SIOASIH]NEO38001.1 hypothetical protein [Moorena sp. SIOASIH]